MPLHIALNIYRAWSRWDCSTETALVAWGRFEREAQAAGDGFAAGVIGTMMHEARGYPVALEPNA